MTTGTGTWTGEMVTLAGSKVHIVKGGSGEPLLLLHDEMGHHTRLRHHEVLARRHTLFIPSHPGYGASEHLEWIRSVRDMAGWYLDALDDLGLVGVNAVGLSLGGWLAAEMAAMCPRQFKKLVIVGSPGILPPSGEVYDMFLSTAQEYMTDAVLDPAATPEFAQVCPEDPTPEQVEAWEVARQQSSLLAWKPYMYDPALPHLLRRARTVPTMIVWGRQDPIVPLSVGEAYREAIPGSRLEVLEDCGHRPELERPEEFVRLVDEFLSGS
jgi:pimeloyl-ACP methyl ester carboxylesterase